MKNSVTGSPPPSPRVSQMIPIHVYYVGRIYEDGFRTVDGEMTVGVKSMIL